MVRRALFALTAGLLCLMAGCSSTQPDRRPYFTGLPGGTTETSYSGGTGNAVTGLRGSDVTFGHTIEKGRNLLTSGPLLMISLFAAFCVIVALSGVQRKVVIILIGFAALLGGFAFLCR